MLCEIYHGLRKEVKKRRLLFTSADFTGLEDPEIDGIQV